VELLKLGLSNPSVAGGLVGFADSEAFVRGIFLNWYMSHLSTSYDLKTTAQANLERLARELFSVEDSRKWWAMARASYRDDANSRQKKAFFSIIDREFQQASGIPESPEARAGEPLRGDPPPPSSL
jgi:hypothetical protein